MHVFFRLLALMGFLGLGTASAQLDRFIPPKAQPLWLADTLYIGASFTRSSFEPVKVWLIGNEAGWTGNLYFIDPTTKQEIFLFTNHSTPNQVITLSEKYNIAVGDTVYFVYRVVTPTNGDFPNDASHLPKYTGPNIPGQSQFVSVPTSVKYGHRWSVAGRVNDSLVQFGFEDNVNAANSDFDYDDIIFGTTLSLSLEEVPASLSFTDKSGKALPTGSYWSPANDTVYVSYSDDYAKGDIIKELVLTVINRKGAVPGDKESVLVTSLTHNAATGIWQAKIPLVEFPGGIPGNKVLETYFLGDVTAQVKSHNRVGILDGNSLSANLKVAYPDKPETIKILNCSDSTLDITRLTDCIRVQVTDQSPTRLPQDTVYAELRCQASGDIISRVALVEQPDGSFQSQRIPKNEGAAIATDGALSCKTTDNLIATYVDEIYGGRITAQAAFNGDQPEDFYFAKAGFLQNRITSIKDGEATSFVVVLKTATPNIGLIDQIVITLTTIQGESEAFIAMETGPNTGVFTVEVPFEFATTAAVVGDHKITGYLNPSQAVSSIAVKGEATVATKSFSGFINLLPALNLATSAYIKDANGDGSGDHVYIVFSRPIETLPSSLSPVFWNGTVGVANSLPPVLSLLPGFPNVLVADFSAAPFPKGLTSVAAGQNPTATLPGDNIFGGQKPSISDSMGPIIDSARVFPFDSRILVAGSTGLGVDTLKVYVSEAMKAQNTWEDLLRFSKPINGVCSDYSHSLPVITDQTVIRNTDDNSYTIYMSTGKGPTPLAGDCVFLNTSGTYTDVKTNVPPIHGEILKGKKPPREIEEFRGYPPVVGVSANGPGFVLINNDSKTDAGSEYSTNVGGVFTTIWLPPADYTGLPYLGTAPPGGVMAPVVGTDPSRPVPMPDNIATVQVISTGEYIADIFIFDTMGNFVRKLKQAFGYHGELTNQDRAAKRGLASYLVWDLKDQNGQTAGQGAYVWKVVFQFKNNKQEIRYTRTGVTRSFTTNGR